MKFQLVSDLHLDVNINHPFSLPSSDIFTVIAGDVSAYMNDTVKWINSNVKNGVFIEGNHIGYNNKKHSIQYWETQLEKAFPIDSNVSYLRNNFKIVDDVVFVGGILFTDYKLDGESNVYINKQRAMLYLNDFKYNKYNVLTDNPTAENDKYPNVKAITPSDYQKMFYETLGVIRGVCEKYTDKKIVVITHHAPSHLSIDPIFETDKANASYASHLEEFILDHPNIKCWCHGHIHTSSDYMIGDCRVVCNPRGYEEYHPNKSFDSNKIIEI